MYTVTTANWNDPTFWSGISEAAAGHTLDFSALGAGYTIDFDTTPGLLTLSDGTTTYAVGESGYVGATDTTLGGATLFDFFTTLSGTGGDDTLTGSDADDVISGNAGADVFHGGLGADQMSGGDGDDVFVVEDGYGDDTIIGGDTGESNGDVIDMSGVITNVTVDLTSGTAGTGTVAGVDGTVTFSGVEHIFLSSGIDTVVLADGSGTDTVVAFKAPTDNGDGTYTSQDQLDVSGLTNGGVPVTVADVVVTDTIGDGTGNAILTFPGGESIILENVSAAQVSSPAQLQAMGIPNNGLDYIVEGTAGDDVIDATYAGDPEGDMIDAGDNATGNDDDLVTAGTGNDSVVSGNGDDTVYAGDGDDTVLSGDGADSIYGDLGNDSINGAADGDTIFFADGFGTDDVTGGETATTGTDHDILDFSAVTTAVNGARTADASGVVSTGADAVYFSEIEEILLTDLGDQFSLGGAGGQMTITAGAGDDTIIADNGDDVISTGADSDLVTYAGDMGGSDTIIGGETGTDADHLSVENGATAVNVVYSGDEAGTLTDGTDTATFSEIEQLTLTAGNDTLDGTNDGAGLDVDAGDGNDDLTGGSAGDSLLGAGGSDTIAGGGGDDTLRGGTEGDRLDGGDGNDSLYGDEGDDTVYGGAGNDSLESGDGNDLWYGGDGDDWVNGDLGNDTLYGGAGDDFVRGSYNNDVLYGGEGNDYVWGGWGDDTIMVENNFGNDTISAEDVDQTVGDTLDLTAVTTALTIDLTDINGEAGSFTDGTSTATFEEIEHILLSSGVDTLVLADGSGADTVDGFSVPTDNGDGTFTGNDLLDVTALTSDGSTPVYVSDVTVTDTNGDGTGDAILTFPQGESLTLTGVSVSAVSSPAQLQAMGIPSFTPDYIVEGTAGNDEIDAGYAGDPEGDRIDNADNATGDDDDVIQAGGGDDIVKAGAGDDSADAGDGADYVEGDDGADTLLGGAGDDYLVGYAHTNLIGEQGAGTRTTDYDLIMAADDAANDSLSGGAGNDVMLGGAGNDTLTGDAGDDTQMGDAGDDLFVLNDGFGSDSITGGEDAETLGDTLNMSAVTTDLTVNLTASDPEAGTVSDGTGTTSFAEIENIVLGAGRDTIVLADGSGADTVQGFDMTDSGDGTTNDQLDVSGLTSDGGTTPVNSGDVTVTDDGSGNALLTFPGGETIVLTGVTPAQLSTPAALESIGIPSGAVPLNYIVEGTSGDDLIDTAYLGDPEGDLIDANDNLMGLNQDSVLAGAGNDTINAGAGADTIDGGAGDDTFVLTGGHGDDSIIGGETGETTGDTLDASALNTLLTLNLSTTESGVLVDGATATLFSEIENFTLGGGDDNITGSAGNDTVSTGAGADVIDGGAGDDVFNIGVGDGDQDLLILTDGDGNDTITGFEVPIDNGDGTFTGVDLLEVTNLTSDGGTTPVNVADVTVTDTVGDGSGDAILTFPGGESLTLVGVDPADVSTPTQLQAMGIPAVGPDYIVSGTTGGDLIDGAYAGDPEGDMVDANDNATGDNADLVEAGAGDDTINAGAAADTILGEGGDDLIVATGTLDADSIIGGETAEVLGDTLDLSALGDNMSVAYAALEMGTVSNGTATLTFEEIETLVLGDGADTVTGATGNDTINSGNGADLVDGGTGDDVIDIGAGDGVADQILFEDGDGNDTVSGFLAPTDNGDGTYSGNDLLDVSSLTSDGGTTPVTTDDVTVTDTNGDGTGDAILTFPGGESITLAGVDPSDVSSPTQLEAMGIPAGATPLNDIVEGTTGADLIDATYTGDPEGDRVDAADNLAGNDNDVIVAGAGNDTILAGAGDDFVRGGAGDDVISGGAGNDTLDGGDGQDTLNSDAGNDTLTGGADQDLFTLTDGMGTDVIVGGETVTTGADQDTIDATGLTGTVSVTFTGTEAGTLTDGTDTLSFSEIETILTDAGDDTVNVGAATGGAAINTGGGNDTVLGGAGGDTIDGGAGDDLLSGALGGDVVSGGDGNDTITGGSGDTITGDGGDDVFNVGPGDVDGTAFSIDGGETGEVLGDTLNITGPATIVMTSTEGGTATWLDGSVLTFSNIEHVTYTACFAAGTRIRTLQGDVPVEALRESAQVLTRDNGFQPVRWKGGRSFTAAELRARPHLAPIRIPAGCLGDGQPQADLVVSPQHRVLISGARTELWFGASEVLVAAKDLLVLDGVSRVFPEDGVTYLHILFDQHEVVVSNGAWTESFQPGDLSLSGLDSAQRAEVYEIFPALRDGRFDRDYPAARPMLRAFQAQAFLRG
ncbi:Hint domain-containing protein [Mesobacterium hydrothermale]|uniref:Hint domain-containing protein n=1 Tax=Mesobacterium hydrothermale TaxID=3111907 RepID=UPI002DBEF05D|nr:Hint domain-containing protein [Mesobacterium sp. TK19101]